MASVLVRADARAQEVPTEIVVTATSDVSNGDTSTASGLAANPGPDGISLREALQVTINDPGTHLIRFDSALAGMTIVLDSQLPLLSAGGVTIDGDIDGDGDSDVTISGEGNIQVGFHIASGGNRLHALALTGFSGGVHFSPVQTSSDFPTHVTFADNFVEGLVMRNLASHGGATKGIGVEIASIACGIDPEFPPACPSYNTWANTTITNNTIEAEHAGIKFAIAGTGDRIQGATVTDNIIRVVGMGVGAGSDSADTGIALETGGNSDDVVISDVVIGGNSIEGEPSIGINVVAGGGRSQSATTQRIRVVDNDVHLEKRVDKYCCQGIVISAGSDDPSFAAGPPVRYLDDNTVRDVVVRNNVVSGTLEWGIALEAAWGGGGRGNRVRDIRIKQNVVRTSLPRLGVAMVIGGGTPYDNRYTSDNRIAGVVIASNRFTIGTGSDFRNAGPGIMAAGIALIGGGTWSQENVVRDVRMARNTIKSPYFGIEIIGGLDDTARRNRVICVPLRDNRIRGARKDVSIRANVRGATGNKVRLGAC